MKKKEPHLRSACPWLSLLMIFLAALGPGCATPPDAAVHTAPDTASELRYARRFGLLRRSEFTYVYLFGQRNSFDTTARYVLYKDAAPEISGVTKVRIPCARIAALSSIYAAMFAELGVASQVAAIDDIDYVNQPEIRDLFAAGKLKELMKGPEPDVEGILALKPDMLFIFGMGDGPGAAEKKLTQAALPFAVSVDHLEESPLARAEWLKFFAAFADRLAAADSIFGQVEKEYLALKHISAKVEFRPEVFSEVKYGDVWYMPGGKSFMATLIGDAGGKYLWDDDTHFGSLPLSFEQVYARAKNAAYWINLPLVKSREQLLSQDVRYGNFRAFREHHIFNNTLHQNSKGFSTYWESGMVHPERILSDLSAIFHPELHTKKNRKYYYYHQLQ